MTKNISNYFALVLRKSTKNKRKKSNCHNFKKLKMLFKKLNEFKVLHKI